MADDLIRDIMANFRSMFDGKKVDFYANHVVNDVAAYFGNGDREMKEARQFERTDQQRNSGFQEHYSRPETADVNLRIEYPRFSQSNQDGFQPTTLVMIAYKSTAHAS